MDYAKDYEKLYGKPPRFNELSQYIKFREINKGFGEKSKFEFAPSIWNHKKIHMDEEEKEHKDRISQAMSYISNSDLTVYKKTMLPEIVEKRRKEIKYIIDAFKINYKETSDALNKVLNDKRFVPITIRYIYKSSGKEKAT